MKEKIVNTLRKVWHTLNPFHALHRARVALVNWRRRRYTKLDYILLTLPDSMPALPETRGWLRRRIFGAPPMSLWELDALFQRIGDDPRPKGIVLYLRGLSMSLADVQTLRASIQRLREKGKRVVCYAQGYTTEQYYLASVCDDILLQPGGELTTIGLREQAVFLKDALDALGVSLDVVAISPFKSAFDQLSRRDISPEGRQQLEWLLDSRFEMMVGGIAEGRGMSPEAVHALINSAPHLDQTALAAGYVDAVLNEEALSAHLGTEHLVPLAQAARMLLVKPQLPVEKYVALLRVSGLMIQGESATPPGGIPLPIPFIGGERAGDLTVVRQVRALMQRKNAAAVVLYVDSPGGSAASAEAMTAALDELAKDRPLVVCMNGVAASGGYYVSTAAGWIVAQPGTITGSIGVVSAKPVTSGVWERIRANPVEFTRGDNAAIFSESAPYTDVQRAQMRASIEHIYRLFVERVARSRQMSVDAVDAVGSGRVWTGVQAKANGLVDELGDLQAAFTKARQLAQLPDDAPLVVIHDKGKPLPPQLAKSDSPAAALVYLWENVRAVCSASAQTLLPIEWR